MAGRQGAGVEDLAARGAVLQIVPGREPAAERALRRRRLGERRQSAGGSAAGAGLSASADAGLASP